MNKILMRAAKNPLNRFSALDTLRQDTIGSNSGNLLFAAAAHLLLSVQDMTVDTSTFVGGKELAKKINGEYDGAVIPLANMFRPGAGPYLRNLAETIRHLKVPFAMLSGGAQLPLETQGYESLDSIEADAKAFFAAVLEKSSAITVRGERTADYVKFLGFSEVEVIGCPSMTRMGRSHYIDTIRFTEAAEPKVAYSIQPRNELMGSLLESLHQEGADLTYIAQDAYTLEMLIWEREVFPSGLPRNQPTYLEHREISGGKARFYLDASTWIDELRRQDVFVGTRIHGALAAISAGTPALLIVHDSRTLELAEYHGIPHVRSTELHKVRNLQDIRSYLDFTRFESNLSVNVEKVVKHLNLNGFETTLDTGRERDRALYLQRIAATDFPPPVVSGQGSPTSGLVGELRRQILTLEKRVKGLEAR